MNYSPTLIKSLNNDIKKYFPHLFQIKKGFKQKAEGISRLLMLDRYSQKDTSLKTLKTGDLVVFITKEHIKFPSRGIGYIQKIINDKVIIKLEQEFIPTLSDIEYNEKGIVERKIKEISKPLELFWDQIALRVSAGLSEVEKSEIDKETWQKKFYNELKEMKILPAGRVLYGAGSKSNVTYFNCYVMPYIKDSRSGIADHRKIVMEIMSRGGGVGTNGSTLRPKNSVASGVGGISSGSVSWLNDIANLTHLVEQGGSRRGAQMIMLADWHPDIIEFIISKMQKPEVLLWLSKNSKDPLIRKFAREKIELKPLTYDEKKGYEFIVNNVKAFDESTIDYAKSVLKNNGVWNVVSPEFLSGSNISVAITNEFMKAVKNNDKWVLKFPAFDKYSAEQKEWYDDNWNKYGDIREWESLGFELKDYYTMNAMDLWDLINFCATYSAEPGVFFIDTANKFTNAIAYNQKVVATNPCGEQPLAPFSVCNLAAINLSKFVNKKTGKILYEELEKSVEICTRLQDNVIDATPYFLEENEIQALGERRVGLGIMGLHDILIWSGHKYGSKESITVIDKIMQTICISAYKTSINLAKSKGSFPFLENRDKFVQTGFVKKLPNGIRMDILKYGIRNSHLLTIAPTGTTGTLANVSTGLEPYFGYEYYRSGRLGKSIKVESKILKEYQKVHKIKDILNNIPEVFVKASDLTPLQHASVQVTIQKWVDSSISKTVNAPPNFSVKNVEKIYMYLFDNGAKGGTVYVDGSRNAQVLSLNDNSEKVDSIAINKSTDKTTINEIKDLKTEAQQKQFRSDRQDRDIGINEGNICPNCKEGVVILRGGCTECNNCNSQLKCGL